jgi:phosphoglycerate dehydrogenase-like enzyme
MATLVNDLREIIKELPNQFTTKQISKKFKEYGMDVPKGTFGSTMTALAKRKEIIHISRGVYRKPTEALPASTVAEQGFNPIQVGEAVMDLILHLKEQIHQYQQQIRDMEKEFDTKIKQKEETIRLLNEKIREAQKTYVDSGRTLKLGDLATIKK